MPKHMFNLIPDEASPGFRLGPQVQPCCLELNALSSALRLEDSLCVTQKARDPCSEVFHFQQGGWDTSLPVQKHNA